mmetsp:Transcript_22360/g.49764  ORF Transcript_22360/g.49764 Transcript_22360/m.49764 type:complete len:263 (-) Transcript_22360:651-1439(-)
MRCRCRTNSSLARVASMGPPLSPSLSPPLAARLSARRVPLLMKSPNSLTVTCPLRSVSMASNSSCTSRRPTPLKLGSLCSATCSSSTVTPLLPSASSSWKACSKDKPFSWASLKVARMRSTSVTGLLVPRETMESSKESSPTTKLSNSEKATSPLPSSSSVAMRSLASWSVSFIFWKVGSLMIVCTSSAVSMLPLLSLSRCPKMSRREAPPLRMAPVMVLRRMAATLSVRFLRLSFNAWFTLAVKKATNSSMDTFLSPLSSK